MMAQISASAAKHLDGGGFESSRNLRSTHEEDMMMREPVEDAVKIIDGAAAHIERLKALPPAEAAAFQRTHSCLPHTISCLDQKWQDPVRGISLTKALKQEQHLLLMVRRLRDVSTTSTQLPHAKLHRGPNSGG